MVLYCRRTQLTMSLFGVRSELISETTKFTEWTSHDSSSCWLSNKLILKKGYLQECKSHILHFPFVHRYGGGLSAPSAAALWCLYEQLRQTARVEEGVKVWSSKISTQSFSIKFYPCCTCPRPLLLWDWCDCRLACHSPRGLKLLSTTSQIPCGRTMNFSSHRWHDHLDQRCPLPARMGESKSKSSSKKMARDERNSTHSSTNRNKPAITSTGWLHVHTVCCASARNLKISVQYWSIYKSVVYRFYIHWWQGWEREGWRDLSSQYVTISCLPAQLSVQPILCPFSCLSLKAVSLMTDSTFPSTVLNVPW
jgi:hypothetical protein